MKGRIGLLPLVLLLAHCQLQLLIASSQPYPQTYTNFVLHSCGLYQFIGLSMLFRYGGYIRPAQLSSCQMI